MKKLKAIDRLILFYFILFIFTQTLFFYTLKADAHAKNTSNLTSSTSESPLIQFKNVKDFKEDIYSQVLEKRKKAYETFDKKMETADSTYEMRAVYDEYISNLKEILTHLYEKYYPKNAFDSQTPEEYVESLENSIYHFYETKQMGGPTLEPPMYVHGTIYFIEASDFIKTELEERILTIIYYIVSKNNDSFPDFSPWFNQWKEEWNKIGKVEDKEKNKE